MKKTNWLLLPLVGILLFTILYIIATFFYPGGSIAEKTSKGFDWLNNYWCDLTDQFARNGEINFARPIALSAMLILFSSLAVFWFHLPRLFQNSKFNPTIRFTGICSMAVAVFSFTSFHDIVINVAGFLGIITLSATLICLYRSQFHSLFFYGIFCLSMLVLNYFIFDTGWLLSYLPVIQKVTFLLFFIWICLMDVYLYRLIKLKTADDEVLKT